MKHKHAFLIVFLVILFIYLSVRSAPITGSSYSVTPEGTKAFYLLLETEGFGVEKCLTPFSELKQVPENSTMFIIEPVTFGGEESLLDWVKQGNRVVLFDSFSGELASLRNTLGLTIPRKLDWDRRIKTLQENDVVEINHDMQKSLDEPFYQVGKLSSFGSRQVSLSTNAEVRIFLGSQSAAQIFVKKLGKGEIWYFVDGAPTYNSNIDKYDNLRLLYQLAADSKRILFDEFHHGYKAPVSAKAASQWKSTILFAAFLLLWLVVGVLSRSVRFGRLTEVSQTKPASSTEFVKALGLLYAEHGAASVLKGYAKLWRERIRKKYGVSDKFSSQELIGELKYRGIISEKEAKNVMRSLQIISSAEDHRLASLDSEINVLENVINAV